jgi:NAD(P)-dependent dehydrogenase (short-subunit alcohol dehydrogenase family)
VLVELFYAETNPFGVLKRPGCMNKPKVPLIASLKGQRAVVTGGSRGLGLGLVEALVDRGVQVIVVARDEKSLTAVRERLGVHTISADITDASVAQRVLKEVRPAILALNAGAVPRMGALDEQTWENFTVPWETDVKAGLYWMQAALRQPLDPGARVLIGSSGAAVQGSPLSGGYAGAKRMLWLMASYANEISVDRKLGIHFQTLVPRQMVAGTGVGQVGAEVYSRAMGLSPAEFLAQRFGVPLEPRRFGEHVVSILTDPKFAGGFALGLQGEAGITILEEVAS